MDNYLESLGLPDDLIARFVKYPPMHLVENREIYKGIEGVYMQREPVIDKNKSTLLFIIGPSGSGKDSSMKKVISLGKAEHVVTATTRPRRVELGELESDYVWITDPQLDGENDKAYELRIAASNELLEHNFHDGAVYGLPQSSLDRRVGKTTVGIIRNESNGFRTLLKALSADFNIVSVFITAGTYKELADRIKSRNKFAARMEKAADEIKELTEGKTPINFIMVNPENPNGQKAGEEEVAEKMNQLFDAVFHPNEG